jgi:hypothetical protein
VSNLIQYLFFLLVMERDVLVVVVRIESHEARDFFAGGVTISCEQRRYQLPHLVSGDRVYFASRPSMGDGVLQAVTCWDEMMRFSCAIWPNLSPHQPLHADSRVIPPNLNTSQSGTLTALGNSNATTL